MPVHCSSVTEQLVGLWLLTSFLLAELLEQDSSVVKEL